MGIKDYAVNIAPALRPLLHPGETVLTASPLSADPGTVEDVSIRDELKNLLDPTILIGGAHPGHALQRAAFGRAVSGPPESAARLVYDAIARDGGPCVVVTDRRLLLAKIDAVPRGTGLLQRWFGPSDLVARVTFELPRTAIIGAVRAPAGVLRQGRVRVFYADGSSGNLLAQPWLADALAEVIGAPRPDTGEERR